MLWRSLFHQPLCVWEVAFGFGVIFSFLFSEERLSNAIWLGICVQQSPLTFHFTLAIVSAAIGLLVHRHPASACKEDVG